jgi:O-antigen/teichoic acid export membrane protein
LLHFLGSMLSWGLSFVCLYLTTNYIGVGAYGTVILFISILTMVNIVADLGFSNAHIKRISEGKDIDDCISTYAIIKINLTCIFVLASFVALIIWKTMIGGELSQVALNVFLIIILYEIFLTLANIAVYTFQGSTHAVKFQLMQVVNPLIRIPLVLGIVFFGGGAADLAWTYVIGAFVVMMLGMVLLYRANYHWKTPTLIGSYLEFSLPLVLMTIVVNLGINIDKVIIGYGLGESAVGSFSTAQVLIAMVTTVGGAVTMLTFPDFSRLFTEGNYEEVRKKSWIGERYISLLTMPLVVVIILFPGQVLTSIFGKGVLDAADTLRVLALASFILLINQVHFSQFLAANRSKTVTNITILSTIVLIFFLLILVPSNLFGVPSLGWGMIGAGLAWLACNIVIVVMTRILVRDISHTTINPRLWRHLAGGALTGLILWYLNFILPINGIVLVMVFTILAFLIFFGIMILAKEFGKEDRAYFWDLINPFRMLSYISSELKKG